LEIEKMAVDTVQVEARKATDKAAKIKLLTLADLDHRTSAARRAHDLIDSIHADLGGVDRLAVGEQQIVQRAALIGVMAENIEAHWLGGQSIDPNTLCVLANAQRRLFETLGLHRRTRTVMSVDEYIASVSANDVVDE
jgi:hypothetical protein